MTISCRRALIIGGGIAGPVLALSLQKAGLEACVFESANGPTDTGGALSIASNGMNVLASAGVIERVRDVSTRASEFSFENQDGRVLARMPLHQATRYGSESVLITRAALHRVLIEQAERQGVIVQYKKRLVSIEDQPQRPLIAHFADGTTAEGDFLVGADGIRSKVRQVALPGAPEPVYTGLMAPGGFSPYTGAAGFGPRSPERLHFIFGQNGFFGYFNCLTSQGPSVVWWSTAAAPLESRDTRAATTKADVQRRLLALHGDWAEPVPGLIESACEVLDLAIHDVPSLPQWHAGRVVLIGDAAHAVAPHSGQGASMALEDAAFLAKLLYESKGSSLEFVFNTFEQQRRPRTDRVIALGRRQGQRKQKMSRAGYWFQQQMIRVFVNLTSNKGQDWLLGYKIPQAWDCLNQSEYSSASAR